MRRESGFTLIELMITVTIASIALSMAVPAFRDLVQSTKVTNATNDFALSINVARTESAKRGVPVYLSALAPETNNAWGKGWRVWIDDDGDGTYDAGEKELHVVEALKGGLTLDSVNDRTQYKYFSSGRIDGGDVLHLCDTRDGPTDRKLEINAIGRLAVSTETLCTP